MSPSISKTQRWLDLIAYLVGRRFPVTVEEIMEHVPSYAEKWRSGDEKARASARRAFERDKDELRRAGIPLETIRYAVQHEGEAEGYRITRRDFYLPYLELIADEPTRPTGTPHSEAARVARLELREPELRLALDALWEMSHVPDSPLAEDARSALRKFSFDLGEEPLEPPPVIFATPPDADAVLDRLRVLTDALLDRKRVRFRYHGIRRGTPTERDVAPYGLFYRAAWYLVGHDATREAVRVFRVTRIDEPEPNAASPKSPDFEVPPDFRLESFLGREPWELGDDAEPPLLSDALFAFPASLWAERNGYGTVLEERPDGSAVRRFEVRQADAFVRWILSLDGDAAILEPPELRAELRSLARAVAAVHGGTTDDDA